MKAIVLAAFIAMLGGIAQTPIHFEGMVRDTASDRPLDGVSISLTGPMVLAFRTDAEGRFKTADVPPGRYRIDAKKDGFTLAWPGKRALANTEMWVNVLAGAGAQTLNLQMNPEAAISGRILNTNGRPAPNVSVYLLGRVYDDTGAQRFRAIPGTTKSTNDRGEYRAFGLKPGDYYLAADFNIALGFRSDSAFATTYYPGGTDVSGPSPVRVESGRELRANDLILQEVRPPKVVLELPDSLKGDNPETRSIFIPNEFSSIIINGTTQALGGPDRVELRLPPGHHELDLRWNSPDGARVSHVSMDVGNTDMTREIRLVRPNPVTGLLGMQDSAGNRVPLGNQRIALTSLTAGATIALTSNAEGSFTFEHIPGGRYQIQVSGLAADNYIASATFRGQDVLNAGLEITAEGALSILMRAAGGAVEGTITDATGQLQNSAVTVLVPDDAPSSTSLLYRTALTDIRGRFNLQGVRPGAYHLFAWSDLEGAAYRNPDFMKPYANRGIAVQVRESGRATLQPSAGLWSPRPCIREGDPSFSNGRGSRS